MKALDEVIKAIEECRDSYVAGKIIKSDALHYLKEYREKKYEIADISVDYFNLKQWWAEQQENPSLTLDELKTMGGKPVWIEYIEEDYENEWVLVVKNPERPIFGTPKLLAFAKDGEKMYLTISGYGKRWQAYRQEKK